MFRKSFWIALTERAVANGAGAVLSVGGVDALTTKLDVSGLSTHALIFAGGLLFSVLKGLAALRVSPGESPSFTPSSEVKSTFGE